MSVPELIFCAEGNIRFAQIAREAGMGYGVQLPAKPHFALDFADQNWEKPQRSKYMAALAKYKPRMATVLDLERIDQLEDVLGWAEEAATWVQETIIVIPKVSGVIPMIPTAIGGKRVRLGYSVPTKYGATQVPIWEFGNRPVHLLGGSIIKQLSLRSYLNVHSADGNVGTLAAKRMTYFDGRKWAKMKDVVGKTVDAQDLMYTMFYLTCIHMMKAWRAYQGPSAHVP